MGFSVKRMKAVREGRVSYQIFDGDELVFSSKSFIAAVQYADQLQKDNPDKRYVMKLAEDM